MQPLVSILITTYNREKYVAEAINSVIASTYSHWEIIVVDDCSSDTTVKVVEEYVKIDARVKLYINDVNLGDYGNRNKAASYANGFYIKFIDADDYIYPTGLEVLVNMMEKFPEAGFGLCSFAQVKDQPFPKMLSTREAYYYNYFISSIFHKAPLSSIIKKEAFIAVGGFDNIRMAGDFNMWHKLSLNYPVIIMPDGIVWYREHDSQEINSYFSYIPVYWMLKEKFLESKQNPLSKEEKMFIYNRIKREKLKFFLACIKRNMLSEYFSILKLSRKVVESA